MRRVENIFYEFDVDFFCKTKALIVYLKFKDYMRIASDLHNNRLALPAVRTVIELSEFKRYFSSKVYKDLWACLWYNYAPYTIFCMTEDFSYYS